MWVQFLHGRPFNSTVQLGFLGTDNGEFIICGLVGVAGLVTAKEENVLKQLLVVDSLRGTDSAGVAVITRTGETRVAKQVGNPYELLDGVNFTKAIAAPNRVIIGHNRFGTQGKVTKANAHPFEYDTLVGAHNGTVYTKWKMVDGNQFDVDSAALYNHMDVKGLSCLMNKMGGAWALTWWDKIEEKLNFLRNKERPLYMTYSKDGKCLFWASEYWMLSGVLSRNGIEFDKIEALPEDMHMSLEVGRDGSLSKPHAVPMPSTYVNPPVQQHKTYVYQQAPVPAKVAEVKKTGVVPQAATLSLVQSKSFLGGAKQVLLEVLSLVDNDGFGGKYLSCYTGDYPYANIRWYFPRGVNTKDFINEEIIADIGDRIDRGGKPSYYKVESNTVRLKNDIQDVEETYRNARGRLVSEQDWISEHGECTFCSDLVLPSDAHAFNSSYQCFCGSCMRNDEVKQYTTFTTLVHH